MSIKMANLTMGFNPKIGFEKYSSSPEILANMYKSLAFQAKCLKNPYLSANIS